MNRCSLSWERVFAGVGLGMLMLEGPATAADLPLKAPVFKAVYDWTGFYIGGHAGYGGGSSVPAPIPSPSKACFFPHSVTGLIGGYPARLQQAVSNHVVLGIEADASFTSPLDPVALTPAPLQHDDRLYRHRARPRRLRVRDVDALCDRRLRLGAQPHQSQ